MSRVNWRGVARDLAILAALSGIALAVTWVGNALWDGTAIVDTHRMAETGTGSGRSLSGDGAGTAIAQPVDKSGPSHD